MSATDKYNRKMAAIEGSYESNPMNTDGLMSSTFSVIKNNIYSALMHAVGLDDNVSISYLKQDPNDGIPVGDKVLQPYTGVGIMQAYNELGNPSCGVYSMHTIA
jgi:hypothetical protein